MACAKFGIVALLYGRGARPPCGRLVRILRRISKARRPDFLCHPDQSRVARTLFRTLSLNPPVSKKYLPLYLKEFQFRFNNWTEKDTFGKR